MSRSVNDQKKTNELLLKEGLRGFWQPIYRQTKSRILLLSALQATNDGWSARFDIDRPFAGGSASPSASRPHDERAIRPARVKDQAASPVSIDGGFAGTQNQT
jgi:hypothetical protein